MGRQAIEEARKNIQDRIDAKKKEFRAVTQGLSLPHTDVDGVRLNAQFELLFNEIEMLEDKLDALNERSTGVGNSSGGVLARIDGELHIIDYENAVSVVDGLTKQWSQVRAAALFVIEESKGYLGHLCVKRILECLETYGGQRPDHYVLKFEYGAPVSARLFLDTLSTHIDAADDDDDRTYAKNAIEQLVQMRHENRVVVIDLYWLDNGEELNEAFIDWFWADFWSPLMNEHRMNEQVNNCVFVAILHAKGKVSAHGRRCRKFDDATVDQSGQIDDADFLFVPMQCWSDRQLQSWLERCGIARTSARPLAREIHEGTGGVPLSILGVLRDEEIRKKIDDYWRRSLPAVPRHDSR